ncbi:MAG TPA: hypothetical protein VGC78_11395 [Gaiellaceae bacterium]|jgi:hypothetical protein
MPNREQRRHPEKTQNPPVSPEDEMRKPEYPQDALDPRAKNSGHGKKTADKWNQ